MIVLLVSSACALLALNIDRELRLLFDNELHVALKLFIGHVSVSEWRIISATPLSSQNVLRFKRYNGCDYQR